MLRAASTNSCCLIDSTSPRTTRAVCIQLVTPMMNTTRRKMPSSGPKRSFSGSRNRRMTTRSNGNSGKARNRSVTRMSGPSSLRKKPESTPMPVPRMSPKIMAANPTASDTRPPTSSLASTSRPRLSVPSGWLSDGPALPFAVSIRNGSILHTNGPNIVATTMKTRSASPTTAPL